VNPWPSPRFPRILLALVVATSALLIAARVLGPGLLEGLLQRQANLLAQQRGIDSIRLEHVQLRGLRHVYLESLRVARGMDLDLEARDIEMTLRPVSLLFGGTGIESVEVETLVLRAGDPSRPLADWQDLLGKGPPGADGPSGPHGKIGAGRWPDVHLASVTGTVWTPLGAWFLREGEARLEVVPEVWRGRERRFSVHLQMERNQGPSTQLDSEGRLGPEGVREASLTLSPPLEIPLHSGRARLAGIRWTPERLALLDLAWDGPSGQVLRVPRVSIGFESPTEAKDPLDGLPLPGEWRGPLQRILRERRIATIEVEQPRWQWIPRLSPSRPGTEEHEPVEEPRGAPGAWLSRSSRRAWEVLDRLRSRIGEIWASIPRLRISFQGATFHPLEPGSLAPEPGRSLANVGGSLQWTPEGSMSLEMRMDCPETAPGTLTWTVSPNLDRWSLTADLREVPLEPWRFLWASSGEAGPDLLRTFRGSLDVDHAARRLSGTGEIALGGWKVLVPAIAPDPLSFQEIALSGRLEFDHDHLSLTEAEFRCGRLVVPLSVQVSHIETAPRFEARGSIQRITAADLQASLPPELLGSLRGMRLAGTFAARFDLEIDTARLESVRLDLQPDVSDLQVLSLGDTVDLGLLRSVFLHQIEETDGTVVQRLVGEGSPFWVPLSEMPPWLVPALTMAEDATFFQHQGFSLPAIRRSLRVNLERGGFVQGASTLSQQLAKNLFLSREKTLSRKIQEALLTWQLEKTLTKERILELYLNIIEWGPEVFGLREAAGHYFAKRPEELTPMETALLVAMIPGPRLFHEQLLKQGRPPALHRNRAEALIRDLGRHGVLTQEQVEAALAETPRFAPLELANPPPPSTEGLGYEPSPMPPPPEPF